MRADRSETATLDPGDWDAFRTSLHAAADRALDHLETRSERPVWRPVSETVKAAIDEPLPVDPQGIARVIEDIEAFVLPYDTGNTHPRFFGWVHGAGTAGGMVAELFAAAINANLGGRDHGAVYIERQVLKWACRMFGLPDGAGGLLVSGTSMATLIALTVARNVKSNGDLRADGLRAQSRPLVGYASAEAHSSVAKAFEILGLGGRALRSVPVDENFSIDAGALRDAIRKDVAAGNQPFAVIGTAGTVNTGAIDPLDEIADICSAHDLWFHVDGAFGGLAVLAQAQADKVRGIERADSIAFDFHKWLHVPYDAGCVLLRDGDLQRQTFATRPDYLQGLERGLAGGDPWFCELGPELSRGFRALKVWLTLKEHGVARLGAMIARNCAQAEYLAGRVTAEHGLELLAPVSLNICCFRFTGGELGADRTDELNKEIVIQLQERGIAAPSTTWIDGRLAIRVNITNHRTRTADLDLLVNAVLELGHDLLFSEQFTGAGTDERRCGADRARELPQASVTDAMPVLDRALSGPEIAALAGNVSIKIAPRIDTVFRLEKGVVHLHPSGLRSVPAASVLLR
ncbi:MAG: pyridoxal phosphate-dependent decarboxylase family protein, partial [Hyphomicrobiales bacterium]